MPIDDPEKRAIVARVLLNKSICRKCYARNPPKAVKCRRCHSYALRPKKKERSG
ncbi:MAG: 50S ribosomal protein L40e [Candidatus Thorarchaeota archaeon]